MISINEEGNPCTDVAGQLQAVFKAVLNAKQTLIRGHIGHRLSVEVTKTLSVEDITNELAKITKYL